MHGLHNLGNTCYLNAMLQALASCPSFRENLIGDIPLELAAAPLTSAMRECMFQVLGCPVARVGGLPT